MARLVLPCILRTFWNIDRMSITESSEGAAQQCGSGTGAGTRLPAASGSSTTSEPTILDHLEIKLECYSTSDGLISLFSLSLSPFPPHSLSLLSFYCPEYMDCMQMSRRHNFHPSLPHSRMQYWCCYTCTYSHICVWISLCIYIWIACIPLLHLMFKGTLYWHDMHDYIPCPCVWKNQTRYS